MQIESTPIAGVHRIRFERVRDERGYFARVFDRAAFLRAGLCAEFPEHSIARNERRGLIRGLHFQRAPHAESKLIRCLRGRIFDVVVDIREGSGTFGAWFAETLDEDADTMLYIPEGCAHGYQTLSATSEVHYLISREFVPASAAGIRYDDPRLAIAWPLAAALLSERDRALGHLAP